jgi:lipopolysaccharide/colanic/teichoic acid biosynthesis glycosyltransferase
MIYKKFIKRLLDIILALIALVILSPLLIPVMLILWATGEHYIFYGQNRIGIKNRTFKIWKFATMLKASPSLGTGSITVRNDPRVLPMGRFLRKTKINELPQVFNILLGDMSVVGPRPLMKVDFDKYSSDIQSVIYSTRPGLTGIASIVFSDEEQYYTNAGMDHHEYDRKYIAPYKGALEVWYQNHISFWTDVRIVFLTAWVIISPKSELTYKFFTDLPEKPANL